MTWSEKRVWDALRDKRLDGRKFRRQHVVGPYVVDFYHAPGRLVIEIDGGAHEDEEAQLHDARRDAWMTAQGLKVIRIPDQLVRDNIDAALSIISAAAGRCPRRSADLGAAPPPRSARFPSPQAGRKG